jgi:drug/metabolite transporter (DMT)-like permease
LLTPDSHPIYTCSFEQRLHPRRVAGATPDSLPYFTPILHLIYTCSFEQRLHPRQVAGTALVVAGIAICVHSKLNT